MKIIIFCKRWAAPTICELAALRCWCSCLFFWGSGSLAKCPQCTQDIATRQQMLASVQLNCDGSWGMWSSFDQSYTLCKGHLYSRNDRVSLSRYLYIFIHPISPLVQQYSFLRLDLFFAKQPESSSCGRTQGQFSGDSLVDQVWLFPGWAARWWAFF